ncbi:hypothetical protein M2132_002442 [Dysgonomonas sp. PH5-45]|uniref:hypothetical protein n=1 Tax=unclassified Dysgonomonas TaxID=2630389 RepID=UPI002474F98C|nr:MULTISPECIES: hypothetical protein [unclassified Dysgonomonas]MDH6356079.1 hypothetical protein [Dysgonomonas sp. PH5-45]MDH6388968.1 hypothetical protein [Dysgonomonas sp. PH5-37]
MTTAYSGTTNVCPDCFEKFDYQGGKWDYIPENVFKEYIATGLYYNDQTNFFILTNIPAIFPDANGTGGYAIGVMNLFLPAVKNPLLPISKDVGINHKYIQENNGAITQTNTEFWLLLGGTKVGMAALKHIWNFVNRPPGHTQHSVRNGISRDKSSTKGMPHGDNGRALTQAEKRIAELEKQLQSATGKERIKIQQTIKNIRKDAQKKAKGETHWRK